MLHCLACESTALTAWATAYDAEYCTTDDRFEYYRCGACGALSISPVPRDRLAEIYPPNYYSFHSSEGLIYGAKAWLDRRLFKRITRRLLGRNLAALDVGGGVGLELNLLRSVDSRFHFGQVVDIDPAAEGMAIRHGHAYFRGRIEDFRTSVRFDLVLMLNLIEHVEEPVAVLRRIRSLLAPGGLVLIKTPNVDSLDARIFRHHNWAGYHCPRHWVLFTRKGFERAAAQAGLAPVEFHYTQGAPFWALSTIAVLARAGLLSISQARPAIYHGLAPVLSGLFAVFDFARMPFSKTSQMFFLLSENNSVGDP